MSLIKAKWILEITVLLFTAACFSSCQRNYTPKPHAYYRISFPSKDYVTLESQYPYIFEYPSYSKIVADTAANAENYWINIEYPELKGKIHLSYKTIHNNFNELMEDSRRLAYKHTIKADAINEQMFIDDEKHVFGILYDIQGDAASSIQFFATDSTTHFLRGSLYFNVIPNKDSLAPVVSFVKKDIIKLMETLSWTSTNK